jgi:hypothetical protein
MELNKSFHIYAFLRRVFMEKKQWLFLLCAGVTQIGFSQAEAGPDFMRSTGKIYVVAAVTLVILVALFFYMIMIDRRISRIEKRHKNE